MLIPDIKQPLEFWPRELLIHTDTHVFFATFSGTLHTHNLEQYCQHLYVYTKIYIYRKYVFIYNYIYIYDYKWWCIYYFSLNKWEGNIQRYLHSGKSTYVSKSHPNKESKMILNQTLKLRNSYQTYDGMPGANICFETIQLMFLSNSQLVIFIHFCSLQDEHNKKGTSGAAPPCKGL